MFDSRLLDEQILALRDGERRRRRLEGEGRGPDDDARECRAGMRHAEAERGEALRDGEQNRGPDVRDQEPPIPSARDARTAGSATSGKSLPPGTGVEPGRTPMQSA